MRNLIPVLFALSTALTWGLYGPMLAKARDAELSPFKPYVLIGVAYLVIAIFGGVVGMLIKGDSFSFSGTGTLWGLIAGTLGALGALFLTLCMYNGGARIPHAVMPIVFGGAVTVSALYTLLSSGGRMQASPMLWVGIVGMLVCVVIITTNAPHAPAAPANPPGEQVNHGASASVVSSTEHSS
jgi:hypothetical protein